MYYDFSFLFKNHLEMKKHVHEFGIVFFSHLTYVYQCGMKPKA
jgi:hypothetical protein